MKIAIWGAGKFGHYIKEQLGQRGGITFVGFVDSNLGGEYDEDGIEIMEPSQVGGRVDLILIAVVDWSSVLECIPQKYREKVGIIKGKIYTQKRKLSKNIFEDDNILWLKDMDCDKPFLKKLETNVMDCCNLNCRGCSHFSNLFALGEQVPFETFCKDLEQIANHVFVVLFSLLGGEVLLNEKLTDYLTFARKTLPLSEIQMVTNGLLIPKQSEAFFDCCKKNDISISISGYRPTLLVKEEIIRTLNEYGVDYNFKQNVQTFGKNIDLRGSENPEEAFKRCRESTCHFFRKGKIYKCPFEALGNQLFSYYDINAQLDGGTDIYDGTLNWDELVKKLECEPIAACRYCGKEEQMEWKVTSCPKLEDWIVRNQNE
jgi:hypothetical protein